MIAGILRWEVTIAAITFTAFTIVLALRTHRRAGWPRWPLQGRWIVTILVASWTARIVDLALVRQFGGDPNAGRTIIWWAMMDSSLIWTAYRLLTGRLVLMDETRK